MPELESFRSRFGAVWASLFSVVFTVGLHQGFNPIVKAQSLLEAAGPDALRQSSYEVHQLRLSPFRADSKSVNSEYLRIYSAHAFCDHSVALPLRH